MFQGIDLYSDTQTRPTPAMKQAMIVAELGDEQRGEDPTTQALEKQLAERLGFERATFFPSATMANQVALGLHCRPGDELVAAEHSHLFTSEAGGPAVHWGVMTRPLSTPNGIFSGEALTAACRTQLGPHFSQTRLVSVENTTNAGGGVAWSENELNSVLGAAEALGLSTHLDGARLFNACLASSLSPRWVCHRFDTVTVCLSKGLGCPIGAVLAHTDEAFPIVRRLKQQMGGALRQSGMLAAAGLYALENHLERLADDHANASALAEGLLDLAPVLQVENLKPSTNMVFFHWKGCTSASEFLTEAAKRGVRFSPAGKNRFRAVTHLDIKREDIAKVVGILRDLCRSL